MPLKAINIGDGIRGETPVFNGTGVPIKNLFDYLETGEPIETFPDDFDTVKREQVVTILQLSEKLIQSQPGYFNALPGNSSVKPTSF